MTQMDGEVRHETITATWNAGSDTVTGTIVAYADAERSMVLRQGDLVGERVP